MTSEAYKRKAISLMNYLKELIDLNLTHITDYRDYPNYLLFSEIPQEEGCFTQAWGYSEETPEIWLEIKKPKEPPFPPIPKSCEKWVREETLNQSDEEPILKDSITNVYQEKGIDGEFLTKTEVKYLRDFPEVLELWKKYIENNWRPWQEKHQKWKRIYKVYKKLFEIYIELGQLGEQYELVVGMGLLRWRLPDGRSVERHLLALKASLDFDEKTGTFVLHADEQDTKVYLELEALDVYQPLMPQNFENIVKELEENPWEQILIRNVLTSIANVLGKEGRGIYTEQLSIPEGPVPSNPEVLFAPALILRKRKLLAIYEHLEQIKKHIENNKEIPENLQKLIGLQESQIKSKSGASKKPSEIADNRLYFPLPSNEQQRSIAEKIKDSQGILVQGPPGTGKSQTIANLICHLLAYGQRILITAKAPRALEVLHGLLPEKIKDLCVSLLGHGQEEVQSLKNSVSQIQQKESGWNNEESQKQIRKLEGELNELLQSKAKKENRLKLA
ncbi:MAG: AAA domain-containing protein, partial [Anaerohalosphaeraceae bacterium]